jgi:hypothetical protein
VSDPDLPKRFHAAMVSIYERARDETGYVATRFLQMLAEHGGVETARRLISSDTPSDGFTTLWEKRRLDLTVETHVIDPAFRSLFSPSELRSAERRLSQHGYQLPHE